MFEFFTDRAKRAVVLSQDEAIALGHDFIGTEHILLGLVGTDRSIAGDVLREHGVELTQARDETIRILEAAGIVAAGGQPAKDALSSIGIDVEEIQRRADATFGPGAFQYPRPAYTPDAKKALEYTVREARALGHEKFGTEHSCPACWRREKAAASRCWRPWRRTPPTCARQYSPGWPGTPRSDDPDMRMPPGRKGRAGHCVPSCERTAQPLAKQLRRRLAPTRRLRQGKRCLMRH